VAVFPCLKLKAPESQERPSSAFQLGRTQSKINRRRTAGHSERQPGCKCRVAFSEDAKKVARCPPMSSRRKSLFANIRSRTFSSPNKVLSRSFSIGAINTNVESVGCSEPSPFMKGRARFADVVSPVWNYPANVIPNIKRRMSRPNQAWDDCLYSFLYFIG
jgi:hypothetical protein